MSVTDRASAALIADQPCTGHGCRVCPLQHVLYGNIITETRADGFYHVLAEVTGPGTYVVTHPEREQTGRAPVETLMRTPFLAPAIEKAQAKMLEHLDDGLREKFGYVHGITWDGASGRGVYRVSAERVTALETALRDVLKSEAHKHSESSYFGQPASRCRDCFEDWPCAFERARLLMETR